MFTECLIRLVPHAPTRDTPRDAPHGPLSCATMSCIILCTAVMETYRYHCCGQCCCGVHSAARAAGFTCHSATRSCSHHVDHSCHHRAALSEDTVHAARCTGGRHPQWHPVTLRRGEAPCGVPVRPTVGPHVGCVAVGRLRPRRESAARADEAAQRCAALSGDCAVCMTTLCCHVPGLERWFIAIEELRGWRCSRHRRLQKTSRRCLTPRGAAPRSVTRAACLTGTTVVITGRQ